VEIQGDELIDFLTLNKKLDIKIDEGLAQDSLEIDDTIFEFDDPTNIFGGHL
jgi:hypothetical protein